VHFLAEKYGYKIQSGMDEYHSPANCYGLQSAAVANQSKSARIDDENRSANKVIETGWTYGSQKALDATASSESTSASSPSSTNAPASQSDQLDAYTQATLEQDPRAARLSPLDRQFVVSESRKTKGYCAKDPELSQAYDCTCFVRTVFNYRIAHAGSPIQTTNFPPLPSILEKQDFKDTLAACKKPN
jgi:hypothetical protein